MEYYIQTQLITACNIRYPGITVAVKRLNSSPWLWWDSTLEVKMYLPYCIFSYKIHEYTAQWLLVKSEFYCVNTSYPMDNSLSGRRGPARQMSEKDVLCLHQLGRPSSVHSPDGVSYFLPV